MKIGVYARHGFFNILGGTEYSAVVLAEHLAKGHEVEIVHHRGDLHRTDVEKAWGVDLQAVPFRFLPLHSQVQSGPDLSVRYYEDRSRDEEISGPYDLFINFEHNVPVFCHAPVGVLCVLFPLVDRSDFRPVSTAQVQSRATFERLSTLLWNQRFNSYQVRTANSEYTRRWTLKKWGIDCAVSYAPVHIEDRYTGPKSNRIVSVGRFTASKVSKKQLEMVQMFSALENSLGDWQYCCAGSYIKENADDRAYLESLRKFETTSRVGILTDCHTRDELQALLRGSRIFWHAAGYEEDLEAHPEHAEHFGISTVEAMAAGCVPVVIGKGGQAEIVEHGVSGFLWTTQAELEHYTLLLARDQQLFDTMSEKARQRALFFSKENFLSRFTQILGARLLAPGAAEQPIK